MFIVILQHQNQSKLIKMKRILSIILIMMAMTLSAISAIAHGSSNNTSHRRIGLEIQQTKEVTTTVHRAPMRLPIEAFYNAENHFIEIYSQDDTIEGMVYLYDDMDNVIDVSTSINSVLYVPTPGEYRIFIEGDGWCGEGTVECN